MLTSPMINYQTSSSNKKIEKKKINNSAGLKNMAGSWLFAFVFLCETRLN